MRVVPRGFLVTHSLLPKHRAMLRGSSYCYLGIEQVFHPDHNGIRQNLTKSYLKRLRNIWSSDLNAKHKANATVGWAVALFRYFFNHIMWSKKDLVTLDQKMKSVIRQYGEHHLPASLERRENR